MDAPLAVREEAVAAFRQGGDLPVLLAVRDELRPDDRQTSRIRREVFFLGPITSVLLRVDYTGEDKELSAMVLSAAELTVQRVVVTLRRAGTDLGLVLHGRGVSTSLSGPVTLVVTGAGPAFRTAWTNL